MPRIKQPEGKYDRLRCLLLGRMQVLEMDYGDLAPLLGCCRQTVATHFKRPEMLTLGELARCARALNISEEQMHAAITIR